MQATFATKDKKDGWDEVRYDDDMGWQAGYKHFAYCMSTPVLRT